MDKDLARRIPPKTKEASRECPQEGSRCQKALSLLARKNRKARLLNFAIHHHTSAPPPTTPGYLKTVLTRAFHSYHHRTSATPATIVSTPL
ncbi:Os07g0550550 [Oryza sativa Japonica Group]|uniref:Os07g0550550 protein n=1 Tax=Oryza sativa subsp. japonica TaxID=39947 RepID=A0A0P0X7R0_ORYSJ|nr:Os07g0550550 [Oryza sativa Japonica Group]